MSNIKKLLSNFIGLLLILFLLTFVYQNFTGKSIDFTRFSNVVNLASFSLNPSSINIKFISSLKESLITTTEKQAKTQTANFVDQQISNFKNWLLGGLINEKLEKDTGEISKKTAGDTQIAMLADSHESFDNLLNKDENYDLAIHLGDLSRVGEQSQLTKSKEMLDKLKVKYYAIPGDHDYWQTVSSENYIKVFGVNYYSFIKNSWKLIFLDDADLENGLDEAQFEWLKSELNAVDSKYRVIFLHVPLYSTHLERRTMGGNEKVEKQKKEIFELIYNSKVKAIVAGDQHYFNIEKDKQNPELKHIVIGALTNDRNLQPARYGVLQLKVNGVVEVKDIEL